MKWRCCGITSCQIGTGLQNLILHSLCGDKKQGVGSTFLGTITIPGPIARSACYWGWQWRGRKGVLVSYELLSTSLHPWPTHFIFQIIFCFWTAHMIKYKRFILFMNQHHNTTQHHVILPRVFHDICMQQDSLLWTIKHPHNSPDHLRKYSHLTSVTGLSLYVKTFFLNSFKFCPPQPLTSQKNG